MRGIVFDNDGLLLDTEPCWTRAEEVVFERHGRTFDLEAKRALVGTAPPTAARVLERLLDVPGRGEEVSAELYVLALEEIANGAEPRPGAVELLRELDGRWPVAVASNSPRSHLLAGLTRTGLDGRLRRRDRRRGHRRAQARARHLPPGLRAARRRAAASSVALEDSPPGAAAARAAGLYVVGVPSVHGVELEADAVFDSLADPRVLETIVGRLE